LNDPYRILALHLYPLCMYIAEGGKHVYSYLLPHKIPP
jgi:hypothetical protein